MINGKRISLGVLAACLISVPANANPQAVIERANLESKRNPDSYGYHNAIMKYDFEDGQLYQVYCAPLRITDIQLEPGESLTSEPVGGDSVRWILARTKSRVNGLDQEHVYVKPTRPDLKTTLSLNTNLRTYHIELTSYETTYMAAVSWNYEQYNMRQISRIEENAIEQKVNVAALNFNYRIEVKKGSTPYWLPAKVFSDGMKTFIQFPVEMQHRECPVLFALGAKNDMQLVNFRVKKDYYVVDRLFDRAELRGGQDGDTIIRISKSR